MNTSHEIAALTAQSVAAMIADLTDRRRRVVERRAAWYAAGRGGRGAPPTPSPGEDKIHKRAREIANGAAVELLPQLEEPIAATEDALCIEQAALDLLL